jgi:hypothetical protein
VSLSLCAIPVRGGGGRRLVTGVMATLAMVPALVGVGVRGADASSDDHPVSTITSPAAGSSDMYYNPVTVQGTAVNGEAGGIVRVELSLDGGATWQLTQPNPTFETWSYTFTPTAPGVITLVSRAATADVVEDPTTSVTIKPHSGSMQCPCFFDWPTPGYGVHDEDDTQPVELGLRFESTQDGYLHGLMFKRYPDNTGPHVAHLWDIYGNLLAEATLNSTGDAYPYIKFAQPVPIRAGDIYVVSYYTPTGHYASSEFYFGYYTDSEFHLNTIGESLISTWPLHTPYSAIPGVYHYGAGGGFPDQTWHASNYWVEPVFTYSCSLVPC